MMMILLMIMKKYIYICVGDDGEFNNDDNGDGDNSGDDHGTDSHVVVEGSISR